MNRLEILKVLNRINESCDYVCDLRKKTVVCESVWYNKTIIFKIEPNLFKELKKKFGDWEEWDEE